MRAIQWLVMASLGLCFGLSACGGDDDDNDGPPDCVPEPVVGDLADGEACMEMNECQSGYCNSFSHAPQDPEATCEAAPPEGDVHVTGNVRDFFTGEVIADQVIEFSGAIEVMQNPLGYPVHATATSDDNGLVDLVLTGEAVDVAVGIVAVAKKEGYYPTGTGLVEPEMGCGVYPPGIRNHDLKLVPTSMLENWSNMLLADFPELEPLLPLGDKAGVIGALRHVISGNGAAGLKLQSQNSNSDAKLYYLDEAQEHFVTTTTGSSGYFVILNAGLAEKFDAVLGNEIVGRRPATVGQTSNVIFATTLHIVGQE